MRVRRSVTRTSEPSGKAMITSLSHARALFARRESGPGVTDVPVFAVALGGLTASGNDEVGPSVGIRSPLSHP